MKYFVVSGIIMKMGFLKNQILFSLLLCLQCYNGFGQQQLMDSLYFIKLHVLIDETNQPACDAEIRVEGSDGSIASVLTHSVGFCTITNLCDENLYTIVIAMKSCYTDKFKIYQLDSCQINSEITRRLFPIPIKSTAIPVINFKPGSAKINTDSSEFDSLKIVVMLMKENPGFVISVKGYTDPTERHKFAKKRAKHILKLLLKSGIEKSRLVLEKGPLHHSVLRYSYEGCRQYAHPLYITEEILNSRSISEQEKLTQECRQVRFSIIATDFIK